jgi:hypothetical protein
MEVLPPLPAIEQPDPHTRRHRIHCKQELIVNALQRFYSGRTDSAEIIDLLKGEGPISLRLIDWFVTNYSKVNSTAYILNGQEFVVYTNYKSQLKAYSKKLFDPFCRRERILFQVPGHEPFVTTVGKLNFFRWAIEKGILDHIQTHKKEIEKHMNEFSKEVTKQRNTTVTAKATPAQGNNQTRRRAGTSAVPTTTKVLQKHDCVVEMRFD